MTTFIDTNILFCIANPDEKHHTWAIQALYDRKLAGPAIICDVVYAEFSYGMASREAVDIALAAFALERLSFSDEALFQSGKAYERYKKKNKGPKLGVLPDFMIGALAETQSVPLLTINPDDFAGYFPGIELIHP